MYVHISQSTTDKQQMDRHLTTVSIALVWTSQWPFHPFNLTYLCLLWCTKTSCPPSSTTSPRFTLPLHPLAYLCIYNSFLDKLSTLSPLVPYVSTSELFSSPPISHTVCVHSWVTIVIFILLSYCMCPLLHCSHLHHLSYFICAHLNYIPLSSSDISIHSRWTTWPHVAYVFLLLYLASPVFPPTTLTFIISVSPSSEFMDQLFS